MSEKKRDFLSVIDAIVSIVPDKRDATGLRVALAKRAEDHVFRAPELEYLDWEATENILRSHLPPYYSENHTEWQKKVWAIWVGKAKR